LGEKVRKTAKNDEKRSIFGRFWAFLAKIRNFPLDQNPRLKKNGRADTAKIALLG
jgi:hypothetical protein